MLYSGEVAIITGGAKGIGKAIAQELSAQGAKAAVFDIDEVKGAQCVREIETSGGTYPYVAPTETISYTANITNAMRS